MKEIVKQLNNLKIVQKSIDFLEDLPQDIYERFFEGNEVDGELDVDKHRWYETSVSVFRIDDAPISPSYLGVRSVTDLFSEQSSVSDMFYTLEFFEMEPIITTTYKIKKWNTK